MKKLICYFLFIVINKFSYSQNKDFYYNINFDTYYPVEIFSFDTTENGVNKWVRTVPNKSVLNEAYSGSAALITYPNNTYPSNDTSSLTITYRRGDGCSEVHTAIISGWYYVNSDTLTDHGYIEMSLDKGQTWINLFSDSIINLIYPFVLDTPVFSGNSNGWQPFYMSLAKIGWYYDIEIGDTILYRFTFVSDSIDTFKDGLMFDDLSLYDYSEGIKSTVNDFKSTIHPNPLENHSIIEFENNNKDFHQLVIYNSQGQKVIQSDIVNVNYFELEGNSLQPGVYLYQILNLDSSKTSSGRIVVL